MTGDPILYEMLLRGLAVGALTATIIGWWQGGGSRDALIAGGLFLACVTGFALSSAPALRDSESQFRPAVALACATPERSGCSARCCSRIAASACGPWARPSSFWA